MTPEQLDSIITHYKRKAVHAYNDNDTFTCNRMIAIVDELEGNYDDYLDHEYDDDHLELYFDVILPKATETTSLFFTSDPYDRGDGYEVLEWVEEDNDEDFNFADTRERLDLLAIDKKGNLVVIENKLDESGKDVTWQAIKYASYCSSLSKQDVINIFQKYLGTTVSAVDTLSEFFDNRDIEDIEINKGNSQRIILVAANFHKEVTSSVLWLQNFNLRIKCFKVTPYKYGDQVMVEFDQIIPIEDTEEFQIKIANKEQEESVESESTQIRYRNRHKFWSEFIEYSKTINGLYAIF